MADKIRIGITERGDAALDYTWEQKLGTVNGAILVTKNLTDKFIQQVLYHFQNGYRNIIIHASCTGWGSTVIEPNVPPFTWQLAQLQKLVEAGFPLEHTVLRIDPIWATKNGITKVLQVLSHLSQIPSLRGIRIRVSILDQYAHVRKRIQDAGFQPVYNGAFQAPREDMVMTCEALKQTGYTFECCAEPGLSGPHIQHCGCVSEKELQLFHLALPQDTFTNPQGRRGCLCLAAKTELLDKRRPCPHNCIYCYWKRPEE